jgi:membrane protein
MATLQDVGPVLRSIGIWTFIKRVYNEMSEDNTLVWASALAYSWLFAIFPFLILLLTLVPYLPKHVRDSAQSAVMHSITDTLGKAAPTINDNVKSVLQEPRRGWLGISIILSLWIASGGMSMTMSALDQCYDLKELRPFYKQRPLAMLLTLFAAVLVILVFLLLPIGTAAQHIMAHYQLLSTPMLWGFDIFRYAVAVLLMICIVAMIYHFGPAIRHPLKVITPGAVFSVSVWIILDLLFRIYVDKYARYDQTYGTVGGAAILLLFFYIIALVLLIGGEINSEIDIEIHKVPRGTNDFRPKKKLDDPAAPAGPAQ